MVFDNVLTPNGEVLSKTFRQMIDQDMFPHSQIAALKLISGKEMQRGLGNGGEQGTPTTPYHIDSFYKTSLLHPLRRLHRPDRLLGVFEVKCSLNRATVHPVLGLHSSSLKVYMETDLNFPTNSGDLIVEVAALIQEPNNPITWASANLWRDAFAYSNTGLHSIVSLPELPALSKALGGQATCLKLGFCATDPAVLGDPTVFLSRNGLSLSALSSDSDRWTRSRLFAALQGRLVTNWHARYRQWERLEYEDQHIMGIVQVHCHKSHQIGREEFNSNLRSYDTRAHAFVICPTRDRLLLDSPFANAEFQKQLKIQFPYVEWDMPMEEYTAAKGE
jgi:hypothetical protein